jgi:hypothetical protein
MRSSAPRTPSDEGHRRKIGTPTEAVKQCNSRHLRHFFKAARAARTAPMESWPRATWAILRLPVRRAREALHTHPPSRAGDSRSGCPAASAHRARPDSLPMSDATTAWPRPTARAPTGASRKSAPSAENPPCARDAAVGAQSATTKAMHWSDRTRYETLERRCLIDEHHGNVVADRIAELAGVAIERRLALAIFERALAARADEDFEKAWSEGHGRLFHPRFTRRGSRVVAARRSRGASWGALSRGDRDRRAIR